MAMEHLLVDGYNAVHGWPSLKVILRRDGLEASRRRLVELLADYAAVREVVITVVFDAHARQRSADPLERVGAVTVRFGDSHNSADHVIERLCSEAAQRGGAAALVVATSDRLHREMVSAMGVVTMATTTLEAEVMRAAHEVGEQALRLRDEERSGRRVEHGLSDDLRHRLERMRRGLPEEGGTIGDEPGGSAGTR
ncbi:MAG: NYN domain-containing protein [Candidatus Dormibacteria bacterium]